MATYLSNTTAEMIGVLPDKTHTLQALIAVGISALILIGVFRILIGCVKVDNSQNFEKDSKRYGVTSGLFQGRWYHYYERGLSLAEGEFWKEAESDFRKAIQLRDGDQLRARTYGVRFILT